KTELSALLEKLEVGEIREGKVSSIKDFGVFVDLGGVEGLVHISELSWARVSHPTELVNVGDKVKVFILGVDIENRRISLGMKQLKPDPWVTVAQKYEQGQIVEGTINRIVPFGAFIQIDEDLEGLIHISELSNKHIEKSEDAVTVGQKLKAKIIKLYPDEQKIGLSIKALEEEPATEADAPVSEQ
ncbi:S1 RNA-binding domain-containing protein, partial [bacterium]|nr:S1 RNA-binding domain-containing protein [bacterium]